MMMIKRRSVTSNVTSGFPMLKSKSFNCTIMDCWVSTFSFASSSNFKSKFRNKVTFSSNKISSITSQNYDNLFSQIAPQPIKLSETSSLKWLTIQQPTKYIHLLTTGPDVIEGDGVFSQYVLPLHQRGYYSMICKNLQTSRHWPMPSFFVIDPGDPYKVDQIPPSRITDFKVTAHLSEEPYAPARLAFTWTAPGDDFSIGRAVKYKFYCGQDRNNLDYDSCKSIKKKWKHLSQ